MTIDWSKAPEGATHWGPETDEYFAGWYKREAGVWFSALDGKGIWHLHDDDELPRTLIQRPADPTPASWNGSGLPPVGAVCQGRLRNQLGEEDWFECKVLVHHQNLNHCAGVLSDGGRHLGWCSEFRPIRTPEQIAAEEREKAVDEMMAAHEPWIATRRFCEKLYDAGYRKQEQTK